MSKLPPRHSSSVDGVSDSWISDHDISRTRQLAARGQITSSVSSMSTVSEYDGPHYRQGRRGSAPEWDHINRFLQTQKSNQPGFDWGSSSRRGSCPPIDLSMDIDRLQPYDIARHFIDRNGLVYRRQSLPNGDQKWGDSTMTMDVTTSMGLTLNGRKLKFKIILLGDCGVGKSSFLQTLLTGKYTVPNTNLTMSNAVRTVLYNGQEVELHFYDTAGQERYRSITASYYRHAQGCLVFFNVNYKLTFEHIESWLEDLNKYGKRDSMAVVLVGLTHKHVQRHRQEQIEASSENMSAGNTASWSDLDGSSHNRNKREIPKAQAEHLASNCYIPYMEADIQNDPGSVLETIYRLLDLLMHRTVQDTQASISIKPKQNRPNNTCCARC